MHQPRTPRISPSPTYPGSPHYGATTPRPSQSPKFHGASPQYTVGTSLFATSSIGPRGAQLLPPTPTRWQRIRRSVSHLFLGDLGETAAVTTPYARLVQRHDDGDDAKAAIVNHGLALVVVGDFYHHLLDWGWWAVVVVSFIAYSGLVVFYGFVYYMCGDISGMEGEMATLEEGMWLSIQTQDTIGYGVLSPGGWCSNAAMVMQAWSALVCYAVLAGIVFRKTSRPNAIKNNFLFSKVAVITNEVEHFEPSDTNGHGRYQKRTPCLVFRFVNLRKAAVCDPNFHLLFAWRRKAHTRREAGSKEQDAEEVVIQELNFEINRQVGRVRSAVMSSPFLALPWTVVHPIEATSPFYGRTPEELVTMRAEVIAVLDGIDEAVSQNLQAKYSYVADEIVWNAQFVKIISAVPRSELRHKMSNTSTSRVTDAGSIRRYSSLAGIGSSFTEAALFDYDLAEPVLSYDEEDPGESLRPASQSDVFVVDCRKLSTYNLLPGRISLGRQSVIPIMEDDDGAGSVSSHSMDWGGVIMMPPASQRNGTPASSGRGSVPEVSVTDEMEHAGSTMPC